MIFLCLIFMVFLIFFIYKNLSSRSVFYLCALTIGWIMAYISFTLYLSKFNYYSIVNQFIGLGPGTWSRLVLGNFDTHSLIRLFNLGIILFYFSFFSFSISFTSNFKIKTKLRYVYLGLGIAGIIQFLFYDPSINLYLQELFSKTEILTKKYQQLSKIGDIGFQTLNYAFLILSFVLFVSYYIRYYKLRSIRDHTLYIMISLLPITFLQLFVFYWAPSNLVKITFSKNFINYSQPPVNLFLLEYRFFPLLAIAAIGIMLYNIYKYKTNEARYSNINIITKKKMDTASLGIRAFTHAIKNHLLAIRSEAEYLQEKFADDEDALYSLKLITESCEQSFQSINQANEKLKHITLNIKAVPIQLPIEKAIQRFNSMLSHVEFQLEKPDSNILVYIDEDQTNEAVYNILKNSVEALGSKGGRISIMLNHVDQWGTITIRDNGPGIAAENVDEIFTPFFSTKPSITNWGIGLSFCHKVITAHGGEIEVTSELGKFTQFNILLPLAKRG